MSLVINKDIEIELIDTCKQYKADKTTTLGEAEQKADTQRYVSQERFDLEIEKVFNRLPSALVHSSELAEPNSFTAVETTMGSLIVSRDENGQTHVFHNACRHRGARIVNGSGCNKRLICPYHAWSYSTDGKLSNVPGQAHCFPNMNKDENGLIPLPSIEKYGFVWVCPSAAEGEDIAAHLDRELGDMVSHLEWMQPETLKRYKETKQLRNGNWKLFAEGGLETYHFSFAHKETIGPYFWNNTAVIDQSDKHFRVVMPTKVLDKETPQSLHDCSHTLFYVFPSSIFLVQKAHVEWIRVRPLAPGQSEISVMSLIPASADMDDITDSLHWDKNHDITNKTLDEDWALGVSIQSSIESGALPYIQYGRNEWACHAFQQVIDRLVQG